MRRLLGILAATFFTAFGLPDRAFAQKDPTPAIEVRVHAVNDLIEKFEYLGDIVNMTEQAKQLAQIVRDLADDKKGIEGVDPKRPIGLYGSVTMNVVDSPIVLLVPIADQQAFLDLLTGKLNLEPKKGDNNTYELSVPNVPSRVYFRFANQYAYITVMNVESIDPKHLIDPKVFFGKKDDAVVSFRLHLDRLPEDVKKTVFGQFELQIADTKDKKDPAESEAQRKLRLWVLEQITAVAHSVMTDGKELSIRLTIDPKTDELAAEATFTARSGSRLAKWMQGLQEQNGIAGMLASSEPSLATVGLNFSLPVEAKIALAPVIDAIVKETLGNAKDVEKQALKLGLDAITPTLKAGELDTGLVLSGPNSKGHLALLSGIKVAEGKGIERTIKLFGPFVPEGVAKFEFDLKKSERYTIHKVTFPNPDLKAAFGTENIWIATSDDVILLSIEPEGKSLDAAISRLSGKEKREPVATGVLSVARLFPLVEKTIQPEKLKELTKEAFPAGVDNQDTVRVGIEGGNSIKVQLKFKGKALKLGVLVDAEKKK